jgi:hypothetical protein
MGTITTTKNLPSGKASVCGGSLRMLGLVGIQRVQSMMTEKEWKSSQQQRMWLK